MKCPNCSSPVDEGLNICPFCRAPIQAPSRQDVNETMIIKKLEISGMEAEARYRISESLLDEDYISTSYLAEDLEMGLPVIMRFYPAKNFLDLRAALQMKRELKLVQILEHENIAKIYHIGEYKGERFISFEHINGETLQSLLERNKKLKVEDFLPIAMQICQALESAHSKNVAHEDLQPNNIFVDGQGIVKVALFRVSRIMKDTAEKGGFTIPDENFIYEPPEAISQQGYTLRSDIYTLGAIFYHMLSGRPLFDLTDDMSDSISNITPFPLVEIDKKIPEALDQIIMKCLEKDPDERYAGVSMLLKDLEDPLLQKALDAKAKTKSAKKSGKAAEKLSKSVAQGPYQTDSQSWMRPLLYIIILLQIVIIGALGYILLTD